jgi:GT2 family glycosyltransferase
MKNKITAFHSDKKQDYYLLQSTDFSTGAPRNLQYASSISGRAVHSNGAFVLKADEWLGSGTFRNSLYLEPFRNFTIIKNIHIYLDFEGSAEIVVLCAGPTCGASEIARYRVDSNGDRTKKTLSIGSIHFMPSNSRVFWHIEGKEVGCVIHNASFVVNTTPKQSDLRMAVLLRTFGRTEDLKSILENFVEQSRQIPYYKYILSRIDFWVLDTSGNISKDYAENWQSDLNLKVYEGPNLGGGGNAGIIQKIFFDNSNSSEIEPQEVLILDDDLQVSLETLIRHFNFCLYRSKPCLSSLPVLKKSEPNLVWEDGGYWGRMHPHHHVTPKHRLLEPTLLKHMERLENPAKVDIFCSLNTCEYSTFIFLGLPTELLRSLGFPAAFFLRGDDIELSLRASKLGYSIFTNPNLAAWHEPGHSYAQEYMAILHGIIINMAYSENDSKDFISYFEQRVIEHSSINDMIGMNLYHTILRDLLDANSPILTTNFQNHYLSRIKQFGSIEWIKTTKSNFGAYEHKLRSCGHPIFHFLYPGYHRYIGSKPNSIILKQPSAYAFREIPPVDEKDKIEAIQSFMTDIEFFNNNYQDIRERWVTRMKKSSQENFWQKVAAERATEIKEVFSNTLTGNFDQILKDDQEEQKLQYIIELPKLVEFYKESTRANPMLQYSPTEPPSVIHDKSKLDIENLLKLNGEEFVIHAYRNILKREPDNSGLNTYISQLSRGVTKLRILTTLANSNEGRTLPSNSILFENHQKNNIIRRFIS